MDLDILRFLNHYFYRRSRGEDPFKTRTVHVKLKGTKTNKSRRKRRKT